MMYTEEVMKLIERYAPSGYKKYYYDDEPLERILYGQQDDIGPTPVSKFGDELSYISAMINALRGGTVKEMSTAAHLLTECNLSEDQCFAALTAVDSRVPICPFPVSDIGKDENLLQLCLNIRDSALETGNPRIAESADALLVRMYEQRGQYEHARIILRNSLNQSIHKNRREDQGGHLNGIGFQYFAEGRMPEAIQYFEEAAEIFKEVGKMVRYANARSNYWLAMFEVGIDYTDQITEEIELLRRHLKGIGIWQERKPLILLAKIADHKGDINKAVSLVEEAIQTENNSRTRYVEMDREYLEKLKANLSKSKQYS
jgi:tetratricopeptide (TPR) repeat protein